MANFALTLVHGPRWDESCGIREQHGWNEHAAFWDALVDDGVILLGGPVGDQSTTLHVVEAADEAEVRRRLGQDPWAHAQLLQVGSIQPWALWLDFRRAAGESEVVTAVTAWMPVPSTSPVPQPPSHAGVGVRASATSTASKTCSARSMNPLVS